MIVFSVATCLFDHRQLRLRSNVCTLSRHRCFRDVSGESRKILTEKNVTDSVNKQRGSEKSALDSDTLALLRQKDPELLAKVVSQHARPLFRACRGMDFSREEAEDLTQEVFTTFMETLDRFEGRSQVRTWLFGILYRKVQERRRSVRRERQNDSIDDVLESRFDHRGNWSRPPIELHRLVESKELGRKIQECMEHLSGMQRDVFVLRDIEEIETDAVCKILNITRTNMFVLLSRARSSLRECLEEKEVGIVK